MREPYQASYLLDTLTSAEKVLAAGKVPVSRSSWGRDDFLTQLARTVLEGKSLPDLQTLFADSSSASTSPLGSPTQPSVILVTWQEWAESHGITMTEVRSTRRTSRQTQTEPPLLRLL